MPTVPNTWVCEMIRTSLPRFGPNAKRFPNPTQIHIGLQHETNGIDILFGCFGRKINGPGFTWWLSHLPGPSIWLKRTPMNGALIRGRLRGSSEDYSTKLAPWLAHGCVSPGKALRRFDWAQWYGGCPVRSSLQVSHQPQNFSHPLSFLAF